MKPYKARSLKNAQTMVRNLRRHVAECHALLKKFDHERKLLAKLAADSAQFFNPLVVAEAKALRDRILKNSS